MYSTTDQLAALQRIAIFSAKLRGHELGAWRNDDVLAFASCIHCGRELRVYCSPLQPDIDGSALKDPCVKKAAEAA
jgi:hypothetical protein